MNDENYNIFPPAQRRKKLSRKHRYEGDFYKKEIQKDPMPTARSTVLGEK